MSEHAIKLAEISLTADEARSRAVVVASRLNSATEVFNELAP